MHGISEQEQAGFYRKVIILAIECEDGEADPYQCLAELKRDAEAYFDKHEKAIEQFYREGLG